jgi:hypothetical protein
LTYTETAQDGTEVRRLTDEVLMTVFQAKLESSSPHHVIYRSPFETLGPLTGQDPAIAPQSPQDYDPDNFEPEDGPESDIPYGPSHQTGETEPHKSPVTIDLGSNDPRIDFSVSLVHCSRWRAVVNVYRIGETNPIGSYTTPLYSAGVTQESVSWDEIFPGEKPPSGIYTYNILVYGFVEFPEIAYFEDNESGDMRLNGKYAIQNMQVTIQEDDPVTGELTLGIAFDVVNTRESTLNVADVRVLGINPHLNDQAESISVSPNQQQGNTMHCTSTWNLLADTMEEVGTWSFVVDAEVTDEGEQKTVPEGAGTKRTSYEVKGIALGFEMWDDHRDEQGGLNRQQVDPNSSEESIRRRMHQPFEGYEARFRAFVLLGRHGGGAQWYSLSHLSNETLNPQQLGRYAWIGVWNSLSVPPDQPPQGVHVSGIPYDARDTMIFYVQWHLFENLIREDGSHGPKTERWYGMDGQYNYSGSIVPCALNWTVTQRTHWWGGGVLWFEQQEQQQGPKRLSVWHPFWFLHPTNRNGGVRRIRKTFDLDREFHGDEEKIGDARLYKRQVGPSNTPQQIWTPNPWKEGRISGRPRWDTVTFDPDDPWFDNYPEAERPAQRQGHGEFNARVMEWSHSFLDVPYSWGGATYGGRQSESQQDKSCSLASHSDKVDPVGRLGSSLTMNGYGIDCSGLVLESAFSAGKTTLTDMRARDLMTTGHSRSVSQWSYLRPGDYAASLGHVVYVQANAVIVGDVLQYVPTIEADFDTYEGEKGRVRWRDRDRNYLTVQYHYVRRRWVAP